MVELYEGRNIFIFLRKHKNIIEDKTRNFHILFNLFFEGIFNGIKDTVFS